MANTPLDDAPATSSLSGGDVVETIAPSGERPPDLLPLRTAARQVDRAPSTLRTWIRMGKLQSWHGEGTHPENAPALVSLAELKLLVITGGKAINPPRPPPAPEREISDLRADLDRERTARAIADARLEGAMAEIIALRRALDAAEGRAKDLADVLERERTRIVSAESELHALRVTTGLPWWRRLLG